MQAVDSAFSVEPEATRSLSDPGQQTGIHHVPPRCCGRPAGEAGTYYYGAAHTPGPGLRDTEGGRQVRVEASLVHHRSEQSLSEHKKT